MVRRGSSLARASRKAACGPLGLNMASETGTRPAGSSNVAVGRPVVRSMLSRVHVLGASGAPQSGRLTSATWPTAPIGAPSARRRSTAPVFGSTSSTVCRRPAGGW